MKEKGHKFCKEYQAVYDAYTKKPPMDEAIWRDNWIRGMKSSGSWDTLECFYSMGLANEKNKHDALINWTKPTQ